MYLLINMKNVCFYDLVIRKCKCLDQVNHTIQTNLHLFNSAGHFEDKVRGFLSGSPQENGCQTDCVRASPLRDPLKVG